MGFNFAFIFRFVTQCLLGSSFGFNFGQAIGNRKSKAVGMVSPIDHGENSLPEHRLQNIVGMSFTTG